MNELENKRVQLQKQIKEMYQTLPQITLREDTKEVAEQREILRNKRIELKETVSQLMEAKPKPFLETEPTFDIDKFQLGKAINVKEINHETGDIVNNIDGIIIRIRPKKITISYLHDGNCQASEREIYAKWVAEGRWEFHSLDLAQQIS